MSSEYSIDPETLAALLDGRLSTERASQVRSQLTSADRATVEAYMDAVAITDELGSDEVVSTTQSSVRQLNTSPSHQRRRRWFGPSAIALAAAAAFVLMRTGKSDTQYAPAMYVAALSTQPAQPDPMLIAATRGDGAPIAEHTRAIRVGMLLTRIEAGVQAGSVVDDELAAITGLLQAIPGASALAGTFESFRRNPSTLRDKAQRWSAGQAALTTVGAEFALAGVYLESSLVASAAGDQSFFAHTAATDLKAASESSTIEPAQRNQLLLLIREIQATPRNLGAIHAQSESLLRSMAN
jgi:hypothetical protein